MALDWFASATSLVLLAASINAEPVNLLNNPGFESGYSSGWIVGGNSVEFGVGVDGTPIAGVGPVFQPSFINVRSGNYAAFGLLSHACYPESACDPPPERVILSQTVAVPANTTLDAGFYIGHDSADKAFGMSVQDYTTEIFVDGVGIVHRVPGKDGGVFDWVNIPGGSTPSDFTLITGRFFTGDRTTVTISYAINGSGTDRVGASFDDFFLTQAVPEPSPMWLVLAGLMALATVVTRRSIGKI